MINNKGEIAGTGVTADGNVRAALLVPDGDCDNNCEDRIAASQNNQPLALNPATSKVGSESPVRSVVRLRNMMRQRFVLPRQPAPPRD